MNKITNFRFSTGILVRLGEELNPSLDHGILELVKNAYDADARNCTVEIVNHRGESGRVVVQDDGNGMTESEIVNGWLVVGKSNKSSKTNTRLGRIPSGDKGLGRLAALRLGSTVELRTVSHQNLHEELSIQINWEQFEKADLVEEVPLSISRRKSNAKLRPGTTIDISQLRTAITRPDVKRLARAVLLLADPFRDNATGFNPSLVASEFQDLEKLVASRYFEDAEYKLMASVDKQGRAKAQLLDWRDKELFTADHEEIRRESSSRSYSCPAARFEFWTFLLSPQIFSTHNSSATVNEVRAWLKEFGGIHFYYAGLRVLPYGEPTDDWVGLNKMRASSPEERPSTNNSVGRIIVDNSSPHLLQKTDRSGFIENEAFREIQEFATDALKWMARKRLEVAERRREKERTTGRDHSARAKTKIENVIAALPKNQRKKVEDAYRNYDSSRDREADRLRREVQLYRTLSTAGITAAVFAHESTNNPIKVIKQSISTIERRAREISSEKYTERLQDSVDRVKRSLQSLDVLGSVTLSLINHDKRRAGKVDIHLVLDQTIALFAPFVDNRETSIIKQYASGRPFLRGSIAAVESIITNLLNNSLTAFEGKPPGHRQILIRTTIRENILEIRVLDNGPGIVNIRKRDIWLPGETTRQHGTGLGLTIVRDAVADLGGTVDAIEKGELGGAEIVIEVPIIGVDR
jgi:signal transduction histidine kinase